jgi:hypothetical protein
VTQVTSDGEKLVFHQKAAPADAVAN